MKKGKLKLITKILAVIAICLISFVGIYVQNTNRMENIVKDYSFSKDIEGYRQVLLSLSTATEVLDSEGNVVGDTDDYDDDTIESNEYTKTENPINAQENLTTENYETTKNIIEKRLQDFGVSDYNISLNKNTGEMYLQIPEDDQTDRVISNIKEIADFELRDSEDGTVYLTNEHLKQVRTLYNTSTSGTTVLLEIELNKEGREILRDLTENEYATIDDTSTDESSEDSTENTTNETSESNTENTTNETSESDSENTTNETSEEETDSTDESTETEEQTQKELTLVISGSEILTTSFDDPIVDGIIDLSMNNATTDTDELNETLQSSSGIEVLLNSGKLPLTYISTSQFIDVSSSSVLLRNTIIVLAIIIAILLIYMIIKHKLKGLLSAISSLGFIALYLLIIRYTNVTLSLDGIIGIAIVIILNYLLSMKLLKVKSDDKKAYISEYVDFILKIVPIAIISIIFSFINVLALSSVGMVIFWGILLMLVYNVLITKNIVD